MPNAIVVSPHADYLNGAFEGLAVDFKRFTQDLIDEPVLEVDPPGIQSL